MSKWTLFSNHGHVLICLSRDPVARLRDVAMDVGITERAVQKIVRDLQDAGMISVKKHGRRNSYRIHQKSALRHDIVADCSLKDLLKTVNKAGAGKTRKKSTNDPRATTDEDVKEPAPAKSAKTSRPKPRVTDPLISVDAKRPIAAETTKKPSKVKSGEGSPDEAVKSIEKQQGSLF